MSNYSFLHPESKKKLNIKVDDNKFMILVYGKNGSGKTCFSKSNDFDKNLVFNLDFIHKNVYVVTADGAKIDGGTKSAFSELIIGNEAVRLKEEEEKLNRLKREFTNFEKENKANLYKKFPSEFSKIIDAQYKELSDKSFVFNIDSDLEKLIKGYNPKKLSTDILNQGSFDKGIEQFKNNVALTLLVKEISTDSLLKDILINHSDKETNLINTSINSQKLYKEQIKNLKKVLKAKNIDDEKVEWIKDGIKLHLDDNSKCIFCGKENIEKEIIEWQEILQNKLIKQQDDLKSKLRNTLKAIKRIGVNVKEYEKLAPITLQNLAILKERLTEVGKSISCDDYQYILDISGIQEEELVRKLDSLIINLIKFELNKNLSYIMGVKLHTQAILNKIKVVKKSLDEVLAKDADTHSKELNEILKSLNLNQRLEINIDRLGGKIKYGFKIEGKLVNALSEGQRHKLALAIFIKSIMRKELKNKTIVFDDPIVSLDEESYHAFKKVIIRLRTTYPTTKLFVLTHNIYYSYIQISNVFDNMQFNNELSYFRMTEDEIKELDINLLRTDDLTLFKKSLDLVTTSSDMIILSGLIIKIFRYMIDIHNRFHGVYFSNDISKDIDNLKVDDDDKKVLKKINGYMNSNKLRESIGTRTVISLFKKLIRVNIILGFPEMINSQILTKLESLDDGSTFSWELVGSDDVFEIITCANEIMYSGKFDYLRDYVSHPRHQVTKQVTSIMNDM